MKKQWFQSNLSQPSVQPNKYIVRTQEERERERDKKKIAKEKGRRGIASFNPTLLHLFTYWYISARNENADCHELRS